MNSAKQILLFLLLLAGPFVYAQTPTDSDSALTIDLSVTIDSLQELSIHSDTADVDSLSSFQDPDSLQTVIERFLFAIDSLQHRQEVLERRLNFTAHHRDSLLITNARYQKELQEKNSLLEEQVKALQEKEQLFAEKEELYKAAVANSNVDKAQLEWEVQNKNISIEAKAREISYLQRDIDAKAQTLTAQKEDYDRLTRERDRYRQLVDSLRAQVREAELENVRKDEANKYLQQRAKDAEEKQQVAANKKKKVRPIQGIAMRMFRTPNWEIRLTPEASSDGTTSYIKTAHNRNAGNVEFDFVTGASVMLWDLTKYFNDNKQESLLTGAPKFDQSFSYDIGFYVGFGGSNLFKNFYVGPSFRFMDFFYLTMGVNLCEYELLDECYTHGEPIDSGLTLDNITAKAWKVKPFVAFNIDLDFLSYIKK